MRYILMAAFIAFFVTNARAHPVMGRGVVCDTPTQVAEYITLKGGDAALETINAKEKNACELLLVAFEKGNIVTTMGNKEITEITVIAYNDGRQWIEVQPMTQYTIFVVNGENV